MIQKQQCLYKAYIGWTKAFCLSGRVKVHAFHCFSVRGERGRSEGGVKGGMKAGVKGGGVEKVAKD